MEANELRSGVLLNDGAGRFTFEPLPTLAQVAPGFGVVLSDFDADGHTDIFMAQNFYSPQRETGRMAGGVGLWLRGAGDGSFDPVWPAKSGVSISGDAASCVQIDLNADGVPDLLTAINNDKAVAHENTLADPDRLLRVRLRGGTGNPNAVGARVTFTDSVGLAQTHHVTAGSGYLSQSTAMLAFGLGDAAPAHIEVCWPDGTRTIRTLQSAERELELVPADAALLSGLPPN